MATPSQVDSDLMFATGAGADFENGEGAGVASEPSLDPELSLGRGAIWPDLVLDGHGTILRFAKRGIDQAVIFLHRSVHEGEILFFDGVALPEVTDFASGVGLLAHQNDTAGFAIQTVDQLRGAARPEMKAGAADEARKNIAFGRMTNQPSRLVDDEQVNIFVNDVK